jgi:transcription initiation factor TFIIB
MSGRKYRNSRKIRNLCEKFKKDNSSKDKSKSNIDDINFIDNNESLIRGICKECDSNLKLNMNGYYICSNKKCGILYKENIDQGAEWRFYGANDTKGGDPTRCGMPINNLLKDSSYGCKVDCHRSSSYEMRSISKNMQWQSTTYKEKTLHNDFEKIKRVCSNNGLTKFLTNEALKYYKILSDEQTFRGLNRYGIIASAVYMACRINKNPRSSKEIAQMFKIDNSITTKGCKNADQIINKLEQNIGSVNKTVVKQTKPISFIKRYCSKLNMNEELTDLCKFIAYTINKRKLLQENTPHSVSAGIVYFVSVICKLNISKRNIKDVSEISEVTINKCYKKLELLKYELVPKAIIEKYMDK